MIEFITEGLAKKLGWLVDQYIKVDNTKSGNHKVSLVFTQDVNREINQLSPENRNVSYLKIIDIDHNVTGQEGQRRNRRLELNGAFADGRGGERLRLAPVTLRVSWIVPLHKGIQEYWSILKPILAVKQGEANFSLKVSVGDMEKGLDIRPILESSLPIPPLEGDIQEPQVPVIEVQLSITNAYVILNRVNEPTIPTLTSISLASNTTGNPDVEGIVADYAEDGNVAEL